MSSVRTVRSLLFFLIWLCVLLAAGIRAAGESQDPTLPRSATNPIQAVRQEREALAEELAAANKSLQNATVNGASPPEHLLKEIELLEHIDLLLSQQHSRLQQEGGLADAEEEAGRQLATFHAEGLSEQPPFSFLMLDELRRQFRAHRVSQEKNTDAVEVSQEALDDAMQAFEQREKDRRQAKEALESNNDDAVSAVLARKLRHAELESRLASHTRAVRELERDHHALNHEIDRLRRTLVAEKIKRVERGVGFMQSDLQEQIDKIDKEEFDTQQNLESLKRRLEPAVRRLASVRQRFDRESEPSLALREEFQSARLTNEARHQVVTLYEKHLERLLLEKMLWEHRYQLFHRMVATEQYHTWRQEAQTTAKQLNLEYDFQSTELKELRQRNAGLRDKLAQVEQDDPQAVRWLEEQRDAIASQISLFETSTTALERTRRLNLSLIDEIAVQTASVSWSERASSIWQGVLSVWHYELTSVDDRPITVSKVIVGLTLLIVGYILSKHLSRAVGRRLLPKVGVHKSAAAALQSLTFYILLFTVTLLALKVVNVPLTAFTVLGGAVAIGVGLGSQNIINNFISGLIILADRPIRVGDFVQLQDLEGVVQHIGARSTRIKNMMNVDIIVPNSAFLQNNVVNWTLSDELYRTFIEVGLAYGSPTREATKLFLRAVRGHGKVLDKPEPIVLFTEFGDNALIFQVFFWIRMKTQMERRLIESDLRYRIDHLFREAGIVIAYPQRDVHLDSVSPLEVRIAAPELAAPSLPTPDAEKTGDLAHRPRESLGNNPTTSSM